MSGLRGIPVIPLLLLLQLLPSSAGQLEQIPQLSHEQAALAASNATARCTFLPQLCDWQLHLYEGHAFAVELPGPDKEAVQDTQTQVFVVPTAGHAHAHTHAHAHALFIFAEVEQRSKPRAKFGKRKRRVMQTRRQLQ